MYTQLEHLIEVSARPQVTAQVMPCSSGGAVTGGSITLLRFPERVQAGVGCPEQLTSALYLDKPADVQHDRRVMDRLGAEAEPPAATTTILHQIQRDLST